MTGSNLYSILDLSKLPRVISQPVVLTTFNWRGHEFCIMQDGDVRSLHGCIYVPNTVIEAIEAWCKNSMSIYIIDYLDKMFGEDTPK